MIYLLKAGVIMEVIYLWIYIAEMLRMHAAESNLFTRVEIPFHSVLSQDFNKGVIKEIIKEL